MMKRLLFTIKFKISIIVGQSASSGECARYVFQKPEPPYPQVSLINAIADGFYNFFFPEKTPLQHTNTATIENFHLSL